MIGHDDETCSWNFDYQKRRDAIQQNVETRYNKNVETRLIASLH